jgi:FkbM family methyltransferase
VTPFLIRLALQYRAIDKAAGMLPLTVDARKRGLQLRLPLGSMVARTLIRDGYFEDREVEWLRNFLQPDHAFIDVGAHFGLFAAAANSALGPKGLVITVEPDPDLSRLALANGMANGPAPVVAFTAGAGAALHRSHLVPGKDSSLGRMAEYPVGCPATMVPLRVLVPLLERRRAVVKVDVEGGELDVLKGAGRLLDRTDAIMVETHDLRAEVSDLLHRHGLTPTPSPKFATWNLLFQRLG